MRRYVFCKHELAAKEAVGVINDLLTDLDLCLLAHVMEAAVLRLFRLQQDRLAWCRCLGHVNDVSVAASHGTLAKLLMSALKNGLLLPRHGNFRACAEATTFILLTAHMVRLR